MTRSKAHLHTYRLFCAAEHVRQKCKAHGSDRRGHRAKPSARSQGILCHSQAAIVRLTAPRFEPVNHVLSCSEKRSPARKSRTVRTGARAVGRCAGFVQPQFLPRLVLRADDDERCLFVSRSTKRRPCSDTCTVRDVPGTTVKPASILAKADNPYRLSRQKQVRHLMSIVLI